MIYSRTRLHQAVVCLMLLGLGTGCSPNREETFQRELHTYLYRDQAVEEWWMTEPFLAGDDAMIVRALEQRSAVLEQAHRCRNLDPRLDAVIEYAGKLGMSLQTSPTSGHVVLSGHTPAILITPRTYRHLVSRGLFIYFEDEAIIRFAALRLPASLAAAMFLHETAHAYSRTIERVELRRNEEEALEHQLSGVVLRHLNPDYERELRRFVAGLPTSMKPREAMVSITAGDLDRFDRACGVREGNPMLRQLLVTPHLLQVGFLQGERAGSNYSAADVYADYLAMVRLPSP